MANGIVPPCPCDGVPEQGGGAVPAFAIAAAIDQVEPCPGRDLRAFAGKSERRRPAVRQRQQLARLYLSMNNVPAALNRTPRGNRSNKRNPISLSKS